MRSSFTKPAIRSQVQAFTIEPAHRAGRLELRPSSGSQNVTVS